MKRTPTSPARPAARLSKLNALWTRITKQCMRLDPLTVLPILALVGGAILFLLCLDLIANATRLSR